MTYELKIDLLGGEKVEEILSKLKGLSGSLGTGGSIFGAAGGAASPVAKTTEDIRRLSAQVEKGKVGVHALGKALKNLGETPGVRMFSKGGGVQGAFNLSPSALARNPLLAEMLGSKEDIALNAMPKKLARQEAKSKGIYWNSELMTQHQFPATPAWFSNFAKGNAKKTNEEKTQDLYSSARVEVSGFLAKQKMKDLAEAYHPSWLKKFGGVPKPIDPTDWKKAALGGVAGLFNPWIGSRILSDVFKGGGANGNGGGVAKGIFGLGGAMGFTEFYLAFKTLGLALTALKKIVMEVAQSFENARQIYAKALQSGMGLQFTTKRSLIASVMGVSETDVFRFGAQLAYLNPKLEQASKILAQTAGPLTQLSWQWKILGADLQASFAILVEDATPALLGFLDALDSMVKELNKHALQLAFDVRVFQAIASLGSSEIFRWLTEARGKADLAKSPIPTPHSWMKQLPASHWEKMGLIVGGGNANYAKETAKSTAATAKSTAATAKNTDAIANFITKNGGKVGDNDGSNWLMSRLVANP